MTNWSWQFEWESLVEWPRTPGIFFKKRIEWNNCIKKLKDFGIKCDIHERAIVLLKTDYFENPEICYAKDVLEDGLGVELDSGSSDCKFVIVIEEMVFSYYGINTANDVKDFFNPPNVDIGDITFTHVITEELIAQNINNFHEVNLATWYMVLGRNYRWWSDSICYYKWYTWYSNL